MQTYPHQVKNSNTFIYNYPCPGALTNETCLGTFTRDIVHLNPYCPKCREFNKRKNQTTGFRRRE